MNNDDIEGRVGFSDFGTDPKVKEIDNDNEKGIELRKVSVKSKDDVPV